MGTWPRRMVPQKIECYLWGPFKVTEVISDVAYRLDLPTFMKATHNAFHVSRLNPLTTEKNFRLGLHLWSEPELLDDEQRTIAEFWPPSCRQSWSTCNF
jgi:hypothetical protein